MSPAPSRPAAFAFTDDLLPPAASPHHDEDTATWTVSGAPADEATAVVDLRPTAETSGDPASKTTSTAEVDPSGADPSDAPHSVEPDCSGPPPKPTFPTEGLRSDEVTAAVPAPVSPFSSLWKTIERVLTDAIHPSRWLSSDPTPTGRSDTSPDDLAHITGTTALAALTLLCGGPSCFPGLADLADHPEGLDQDFVAEAAAAAIQRIATDHSADLRANADRLAQWMAATSDDVVATLAPALIRLLTSARLDRAAHNGSLALATAQPVTMPPSADSPSAAETISTDDVVELFRRVQRLLGTHELVAVPTSLAGDRGALAAVADLMLWTYLTDTAADIDDTPNDGSDRNLSDQAQGAPHLRKPGSLIGQASPSNKSGSLGPGGLASTALRATDLLRLRAGDHIGPVAVLRNGQPLFAHRRTGLTLLLGPPGSGKTSTLNLIAAGHPGPVVATTSKVNDWAGSFASTRVARGPLWVFDPGEALDTLPAGGRRVRWDLISLCRNYELARRHAHTIASAAPRAGVENSDFWLSLAELLLAPLLLAAHCGSSTIGDAVGWLNSFDMTKPTQQLTFRGHHEAAASLKRLADLDPRTRDSVMVTAMQILTPFSTGSAQRLATTGDHFDPRHDLIETNGTLLLCLDVVKTGNLTNMVAAFLDSVIRARVDMADHGHTGSPLLLAGDEIANIAPLRSLPRLLSEGPGRGIQGALCLQDSSQATARWGTEGDLFLTSSGHRVLFPGVSRPELLGWVQPLLDGATRGIAGFNRPIGGSIEGSASGPLHVGAIARQADGEVTVITPRANVISAVQARAQYDPVYRMAALEARCCDIAWHAVRETAS